MPPSSEQPVLENLRSGISLTSLGKSVVERVLAVVPVLPGLSILGTCFLYDTLVRSMVNPAGTTAPASQSDIPTSNPGTFLYSILTMHNSWA
jgi:hypothetical protein